MQDLNADLMGRAPRERSTVDVAGSREVVRYWTIEFGCTELELRAAVGAVGCVADDVRARLAKRHDAAAPIFPGADQ